MRVPKDIIIIKGKTLEEHLELHKKWLKDENGGVKLELFGANLRGANLRGANLGYSILCGSNLSGTDLRGADLCDATLYGANLRSANLRGANLRGADLYGANLSGADLSFSQLNLSCKGLNFKIDERIAKQLMYHVINLMQCSDLDTSKIVKKRMYKWLEDSHVVTEHNLPILKVEE